MPKTKTDPRKAAILDKIGKASAAFERWYTRLKRAFNAMERERQRVIRLQRQLANLGQDGPRGNL